MNNVIGNITESLYGNFRTRKFTDIYPNVSDFLDDYVHVGIPTKISTDNATTLYYLLYARYGNSHIVNNDENQFKYRLFSTIFMYGPTWEKRLDIQDKVRNLTEEELLTGSKQINNHSYNPSTAPSTDTLDELTTINEQTASKYKKSKMDAYGNLLALLETDVTESFISKFRKLFLVIAEPQDPLWYVTENEEE